MAKKNSLVVNIVIGIIIVIIIIFIIYLFIDGSKYKGQFEECRDIESGACFYLTCKNSTQVCGDYAYRCNSDGKIMCSFDPTTLLDDKFGLCEN